MPDAVAATAVLAAAEPALLRVAVRVLEAEGALAAVDAAWVDARLTDAARAGRLAGALLPNRPPEPSSRTIPPCIVEPDVA